MSRLAIERISAHRPASRRGAALVSTLVVVVSLMGLLYAASTLSVVEVKESRVAVDEVRSKYLAEAGIERGMHFVAQAVRNTNDPLRAVNDLFLAGPTITPFVGEGVLDAGNRVGSYSVSMSTVAQTPTSVTLAIDATGYLPDAPGALAPGQQVSSWHSVRTTVRYSLAPSKVFDYAYFINNWGWFYGSTIYCNGNARSNGQFDVAGYAPTITGQPLYDSVAWNGVAATLSGYQDDNEDGLLNGQDGGVFSGWDIVGAQNLQGNGGLAKNQHDFQETVDMPNLTDLSRYEAQALAANSSITINGTQYSDAVYGDEAGEKQNLYLVGTNGNPIVINGPVVVRGNVVIRGVVQGQGAIYAGKNVYLPNSLTYKNRPATARPANNTQAATQAWLSANWNKDFVGLFSRENIVVGDYTHALWQFYVGQWMADDLNQSEEDAGADGIPHTRAGRDGVLGTADDDVLEGDGVFTIEHYTAADQAAGLIPAGKNVGDPIPGSGEDIDGDGAYDDTTTLADVALPVAINSTNFGGNVPGGAGVPNYNTIATLNANNIDAVLYTNHSFCWVVTGGGNAEINGALVSRNENIVYGTPTMKCNHDVRLLGGSTGRGAAFLPAAMQPPQILSWSKLDRDPNRYLAP